MNQNTEQNQTNAASWPRMIKAVYASFDTGRHQGDAVARRVMDRAVSWLVSGLELSPRLQARLIENINMRTAFKVCDPGYPIHLTRHQISYAKKTNPEWFDLGLAGQEEPAENVLKECNFSAGVAEMPESFQQLFSEFSASFQQLFSEFSARFQQTAESLVQNMEQNSLNSAVSGGAAGPLPSPKVMEWEEKKSNLDDEPMTRPEDGVRLASSPEVHEQGADRDVGGSHCQDGTAHREHGSEPCQQSNEVVVSFFHNDATRPPSANVEIGSDRFALVFSDADVAEDQIAEISSKDWCRDFAGAGGDLIRAQSRAAGSSKTRYRLSPLYDARDTFARKAPVEGNAVAILFWNDDEQPEQVTIVRGTEVSEVALRKFHGRHAKAPSHKGIAKQLAA